MTDRAPERAAAATVLLVASALVVMWSASRPRDVDTARGEAFQRAVGGLGGGPALALRPCASAFDGRVAEVCGRLLEPVPGGVHACPHHAGVSLRR